jgi:hypothetical protein
VYLEERRNLREVFFCYRKERKYTRGGQEKTLLLLLLRLLLYYSYSSLLFSSLVVLIDDKNDEEEERVLLLCQGAINAAAALRLPLRFVSSFVSSYLGCCTNNHEEVVLSINWREYRYYER